MNHRNGTVRGVALTLQRYIAFQVDNVGTQVVQDDAIAKVTINEERSRRVLDNVAVICKALLVHTLIIFYCVNFALCPRTRLVRLMRYRWVCVSERAHAYKSACVKCRDLFVLEVQKLTSLKSKPWRSKQGSGAPNQWYRISVLFITVFLLSASVESLPLCCFHFQ